MRRAVPERLFAVLWILLGYGFIRLFAESSQRWCAAVYTLLYALAVLLYLYARGKKPPRESWFWLAVLLCLGVPLSWWTVLDIFQYLLIMCAAAYWTLAASGQLLGEGKTSEWFFFDCWNALARVPFGNFIKQPGVLFGMGSAGRPAEPVKKTETEEGSEKEAAGTGKGGWLLSVLLGLVIAVPLLLILLPLLSRADAGFERVAGSLAEYIQENFLAVFLRFILSVPVSLYLYGLIYGGIYGSCRDGGRTESLQKTGERIRQVPQTAVCTALVTVCLVYALFIGLQGNYLFAAFAGKLPAEFTYAEYARRGFFELCQAGVWNLLILGLAELFAKKSCRKSAGLAALTALLSAETLLLIVTAMSKLGMYISVYGLTVNRVIPFVFLVWMALVFGAIPVRLRKEFALIRFCVLAGAVLICLLCVIPVESCVESYNSWAHLQGWI